MKTIRISPNCSEVNEILEQASNDDLILRSADGREFMITVIDDSDEEVARMRHNAKLMAFLDERSRQTVTIPLNDVKKELGLT